MWHGGIGHFLLDYTSVPTRSGPGSLASGMTVWASNQYQNGSLEYITQGPPDPISKPVFASAIAHGNL